MNNSLPESGNAAPAELAMQYQHVVTSLLPSGSMAERSNYTLLPAQDVDGLKRRLLDKLHHTGLVARVSDTIHGSSWHLTAKGRSSIRTFRKFGQRECVFKPREGLALNQLTAFELYYKLLAHSWQFRMKIGRPRKGKETPTDYVEGGRKEFWWKQAAKTF